jgi:hypothetical protein
VLPEIYQRRDISNITGKESSPSVDKIFAEYFNETLEKNEVKGRKNDWNKNRNVYCSVILQRANMAWISEF